MVWNIYVSYKIWIHYIRYSFSSFHMVLFSYLLLFVSVKTCTTSKLSITWPALDSNTSVWTWWNWQSLHVSWHQCITPLLHALLKLYKHSWKCTWHGINYTVKMCNIIIQVNSLLRFNLRSNSTSLQFNPPKTTILCSLKCSWNLINSGRPPPFVKSIHVVASKLSTTRCIFLPWIHAL
jgi:hypothetical protein